MPKRECYKTQNFPHLYDAFVIRIRMRTLLVKVVHDDRGADAGAIHHHVQFAESLLDFRQCIVDLLLAGHLDNRTIKNSLILYKFNKVLHIHRREKGLLIATQSFDHIGTLRGGQVANDHLGAHFDEMFGGTFAQTGCATGYQCNHSLNR